MILFFYFLVAFLCFYIVFKSADVLVESSSGIARHFGISDVFIGLVLVALGTSAPEIFVTGFASFLGHPDIVVGNATGSIAANTGVAFAIIFLLVGKKGKLADEEKFLSGKFCSVNALFLLPGSVAMIFVARDGISRVEGFVFIVVIAVYFFANSKISAKFAEIPDSKGGAFNLFLKFFFSILTLALASRGVVWSAGAFARGAGISEFVIAITMIAFGTSVPEIATSITAMRKGKIGIAVSELVGSQALNLYLLLGVSSLVRPVTVKNPDFAFGWTFIFLLELFVFLRLKKMAKLKAAVLLGTYAVYLGFAAGLL
ncbi:MAG: sodium:calcium antiporter [Elusimicrobia bacterium]|nr:sodium:calcium antiporter [Elusimicrobiota bacterium]